MEVPGNATRPLADPGNVLLAPGPQELTTGKLPQTPDGPKVVLTIRTPTTTLTVMLGKADAITWGRKITGEAEGMSGAGLITGNGHMGGPP
jgi:hypothetical protein